MKSKFFSIIAFLLLYQISNAQNLMLEFPLEQKRTEIGNYQQTLDLTGYSFQDFIALSVRIEGDDLIPDDIRIQVQSKDSVYFLHQFYEEITEGKYISELVYIPVSDAGILKFTFDYEPGIEAGKLTGMIRFFSPGGVKSETPKSKKKVV